MTEKAETKTYGFATRAVHVGNGVDQDSGAIKRPITMANSYALPYAFCCLIFKEILSGLL